MGVVRSGGRETVWVRGNCCSEDGAAVFGREWWSCVGGNKKLLCVRGGLV